MKTNFKKILGLTSTLIAIVFIYSAGITQAISLPPTIDRLSQTSGPIGAQITIYGSGFSPSNCNGEVCTNVMPTNTINFGSNVIQGVLSQDGATLSFTVPATTNPACLYATPACRISQGPLPLGSYDVSVKNLNGTSNAAPFVVTDASVPTFRVYNLTNSSRNPGFLATDVIRFSASGPANTTLKSCWEFNRNRGCDTGTYSFDSIGAWSLDGQVLGISVGDWSRWVEVNGVKSNVVNYVVYDSSNSITVTSPTADATLIRGQNITVSWQYYGPSEYAKIRLSSQAGRFYDVSPGLLDAGTATFFIPADFPLGVAKLYVMTLDGTIWGMAQGYMNITDQQPLSITTPANLVNGLVGVNYSTTISGSGGVGGYSWSVVQPYTYLACTQGSSCTTLPPGLTLSQNTIYCIRAPCPNNGPAIISGIPTTAGVYRFSLNLSDSSGSRGISKEFTINIGWTTYTPTPTPTPTYTPNPTPFPVPSQRIRLMKSSFSPKIYYATERGYKRWIPTVAIFNSYGNRWQDVVTVDQSKIDSMPEVILIRASGDFKVYKLENGTKRWITSADAFNRNGFQWDQIAPVNTLESNYYPIGASIN